MRVGRTMRPRGERGAVLVEFGLLFPLLVLVLIGTINVAHVYFDHTSATNAVREAARYGASADATSGSTWATSVRTRLQQVYFDSGHTATDNQICVELVDSNGNVVNAAQVLGTDCGAAPTRPTMSAGGCAVMVWVRTPGEIGLAVAPSIPVTIAAESVARYGRTVGTSCTGA